MRFAKRKWGWYLTLLDRKHFKVKLLRFYLGQACSRQYHDLRSELWLFLSGSGTFNSEKLGHNVGRGDFAEVKEGALHNYYAYTPTLVLEIQYGEKCDEEDIVRV